MSVTPERVLLVEAAAVRRSEVAAFLRGCGYQVVEAADATEAQTVLGARHIDILVTDLQLRDAWGFELAAEARMRQPAIRVIVTRSAERTARIAQDLCDEGPLPSPYHPQQLLERIRRQPRS